MLLAGGATASVIVLLLAIGLELFELIEPRALYSLADKGCVVVPILFLAGYQSGKAFLEIWSELKQEHQIEIDGSGKVDHE